METEWRNTTTNWRRLTAMLSRPVRTAETVRAYSAMSRQEKGRIKDIGGFVGGEIRDGRRKAGNIVSRSIITLDIDFGGTDTPDIVAGALDGLAWCLYSTHSHTPEHPRYRVVLPLDRPVTAEEYVPIARRVAERMGIGLFDPTTYEPHRLMYWPSCSSDGEFVFRRGVGKPVSAGEVLGTFADWRNAAEWPCGPMERPETSRGRKQEDPTEKRGTVGVFCRAYTITEAIDTFIPGVYTPTSHPDRYTYSGGTSAGGAVVYEDKWLYSHHGTDPASGRLCNAFDLVRIHRFGNWDEICPPDTPANRLPSFIAMEAFAEAEPKVQALIAREKAAELTEDFGGIDTDGDGGKWTEQLQYSRGRAHDLLPSPHNFRLILENDPELRGMTGRDLFRSRDAVLRNLPWRKAEASPWWGNTDDSGLSDFVSRKYRLSGREALAGALDLVTSMHSFHPVRDWLSGLVWDGRPRLDTMLCTYLGAEDTPLVRAMTRKHFTAAVARVMTPGCKYDHVLTLIGPEGIGKSTQIRTMGRDWYDDSVTSIDGKEGMDQLRGKWLIEMGELTNYKKSTSEAYKAFLSKQEDVYRPAYARKAEVYPRQCVFFATTNETAFLKGDTGNRRFWTVDCGLKPPEMSVWDDLPRESEQIWAEALTRFRQGEPLYLSSELEAEARRGQEEHNEVYADERTGRIQDFISQPIPEDWNSYSLQQRLDYWKTGQELWRSADARLVPRKTVCAVELLAECFGERLDDRTRYRTKEINQILKSLSNCKYEGQKRVPIYGVQRIWSCNNRA